MESLRPTPENIPFWDRSVTLARLRDGKIEFTKTVIEKERVLTEAVNGFDVGDLFFLAWTGQYSVDLFDVDLPQLVAFLKTRKDERAKKEATQAVSRALKKAVKEWNALNLSDPLTIGVLADAGYIELRGTVWWPTFEGQVAGMRTMTYGS